MVVTVAHEEIADLLPDAVSATVGEKAVLVVAWLTAAVTIIRRVTPVPVAKRGLLE